MIYANSSSAPREELSEYVMESATQDGMFQGLGLLPASPLKLPTGHYPKITVANGDLMRAAAANRAPGARFARTQSSIDDGTLSLLQIAEEVQVPDEQGFLYEDYFSIEQVFSLEAKNKVQRAQEVSAAAALFSTGNFDAVNSTVAYTTANAATMDPVADILAAIRRVKGRGELSNTLVLSGTVYDRVRVATKMINFVAGANQPGAVVAPNTIQRAFEEHGIKKVVVADSYVNQSIAGKSDVINPIWSNTYMFVGNVASGPLQSGGVGRTFFFEKEGPLFNISSYRDEPVKSNVIRAMATYQCAITNTRAGTLITTQYS